MNKYQIFPFNFKKLNNNYLITNLAGSYLYLSKDELQDFVDKKLSPDSNIYLQLKSNFFLADSIVNINGAITLTSDRLRTKKKHVFEKPTLHMIVLTRRCNLACLYCHASSIQSSDYNKYDLDWHVLKDIINYIFKHSSDILKIEFQGGETSLRSDLLYKGIKYSEKLAKYTGKEVSFVICSNLFKIDRKFIKCLKRSKVYLSTSLDGPKIMHDEYRTGNIDKKSSYDNYKRNVDYIKKRLNNKIDINALVTVTDVNINRLTKVIDEYVENGYSSIFLRPVSSVGRADEKIKSLGFKSEDFVKAYIEALKYIFELNDNGVFIVEGYADLMFRNILLPYNTGFADIQSPTGMSTIALAYEINGDIYASDEGRMLSYENDDYFKIGNIYKDQDGLSGNKMRAKLITNTFLDCVPGCMNCAYNMFCGLNIVSNYKSTKDITRYQFLSYDCRIKMGIFDYFFNEVIVNKENMRIIKGWIGDQFVIR